MNIKLRVFATALVLCTAGTVITRNPREVLAQVTPTIEPQNIRVEDGGRGTVRIIYDLMAPAGAIFTVAMRVSVDGGGAFDVAPATVSGDIGANVSGGSNKTVIWQAAKDVERIAMDRIQVRITAVRTDRPQPQTTAASTPPPSTSAPPRKSNAKLFAIIGGAAAAAGGAMALGGGGGEGTPVGTSGPPGLPPSTSTSNRPPFNAANSTNLCGDAKWSGDADVVGNTVAIATATTITFSANAADPDNDPLTFTFNFGNGVSTTTQGRVGGTPTSSGLSVWVASAGHVYANAGRFNATTTVSDGRGGEFTCGYNAIVVDSISGTWNGGPSSGNTSSTLILSQNGSRLSGTFLEDGRSSFSIDAGRSGVSQSGDFAAVRVSTFRSGQELTFSLDPSMDLRTLTGTFSHGSRAGSITFRRQ